MDTIKVGVILKEGFVALIHMELNGMHLYSASTLWIGRDGMSDLRRKMAGTLLAFTEAGFTVELSNGYVEWRDEEITHETKA